MKKYPKQAGSRDGSRRAILRTLSRTDTQMDGQTLCDNKG